MPERIRGQGDWTVEVKPAGTLREAEAAAGRARRLVAEWIQKRRETGGQETCL